MKYSLLRFFTSLALSLVPLHAADDPRVARLTAADDERVAAVVAADAVRLKAIYSEELRYGHSTGAVDDKPAYVDALLSGKTKYLSWNYDERKFSFPARGVALMTGRTRIEVAKADGTAKMVLGFLGVWREEEGQWRFLSWQSCKLPDPAPAVK